MLKLTKPPYGDTSVNADKNSFSTLFRPKDTASSFALIQ